MGLGQRAVEAVAMKDGRNPDPAFWAGKRVLLTGHTGFKGAWLAIWLRRLGAVVSGISLDPITKPSLFALSRGETLCDSAILDIRDAEGLSAAVRQARPQIVFHLAAQALVRAGYRDPAGTFAVNAQGTANLLDALRGLDARAAVMVTTDKVYHNHEHAFPYRETDRLGGHDPYSASKAAAELIIASYRDSFLAAQGTAVASARAGNVIGGGDWSEDRLIPDAVRAWQAGRPLEVRRPDAIRPWQHVLEPLCGYLILAESLWRDPSLAGAYNFGPHTHEAADVRTVIDQARRIHGGEAVYGDGTEGPHEAGWLALENAKARAVLSVTPRLGLTETIERTFAWYRRQADGLDALSLCEGDIADYEALS